jgi:hypothetical protein
MASFTPTRKKSTPRPSGNRICAANREFYAFFIMQKYYGLEGWRGGHFDLVTSGGKRGPAPARGSLRRPGQRGLAQEAGNANSGPRRCWIIVAASSFRNFKSKCRTRIIKLLVSP